MIVDCPPSLGQLTRSALAAAHRAVLVTDPTMFAVSGVQRAFDAVQTERERANPDLQPLGVLINRVRPRNTEHEFRIAELRELFGPLVLSGVLPDRIGDPAGPGCMPAHPALGHARRPRGVGGVHHAAGPGAARSPRRTAPPRPPAAPDPRPDARRSPGGPGGSAPFDQVRDQLDELLGLLQEVVRVASLDQPLDPRLRGGAGGGARGEVGGPLGQLRSDFGRASARRCGCRGAGARAGRASRARRRPPAARPGRPRDSAARARVSGGPRRAPPSPAGEGRPTRGASARPRPGRLAGPGAERGSGRVRAGWRRSCRSSFVRMGRRGDRAGHPDSSGAPPGSQVSGLTPRA